jgi:uncharacterized protein YuzE
MAKKMIFAYDKEGDVLDISFGRPRRATSDEVAPDIFVRLDPKSSEVVGFMILNFSQRFKHQKETTIPVAGHLMPVR